ncbi:MAG: GvpL/GvpF family gas vesicle protein [Rhabdochlamydiaceae bacterium]
MKKIEASKVRIVSSGFPAACYVYGIIDFAQRIILKSKAIGFFGKIYSIPYKDIGALVSRTSYSEYDPSEENLMTHNEALFEAYREYRVAVLPLRFSTVAKSETDVLKILSAGYSKFKIKMASLSGKLEFAVKVYCNIEGLKIEITQEKNANGNAQPEEEVKQRSLVIANNLLQRLKSVAVDHQLNELIFEDAIMNAAFLVEERSLRKFTQEIAGCEKRVGRNFRIKTSGPYVPYSFTEPPKTES